MDHPLNEQHEWGGYTFRPTPPIDTGGQTLLARRPATETVPSQVPFTASHSDDLFAPATGGPSHFPPYILPTIPELPRRPVAHHSPTLVPPFPRDTRSSRVPLSFPPFYHRTPLPHHDEPLHPVPPRIYAPFPHPLPQPPLADHLPYPIHPPYDPHTPLHYQNPPIQYVYVPTPPSDTSLPSPSKSLPVITTIHSLNSKSDFFAWDEGVCTLLRLLGIHGHIVDPALPVDPLCPDQSPALMPPLSQPPTPAEMKAFTRWKDNDNVAQ